jgi:hypothetical protein
MTGVDSLDTVILIANSKPLTTLELGIIAARMEMLKGTSYEDRTDVLEVDYTGGAYNPKRSWSSGPRSLGRPKATDEKFHEVVLPIAARVDALRALRFSHVERDAPGGDGE